MYTNSGTKSFPYIYAYSSFLCNELYLQILRTDHIFTQIQDVCANDLLVYPVLPEFGKWTRQRMYVSVE
jgi:hypothetical protein